MVSFITPPVALAAIAAASVAKADAMQVGFKALRIGSVLLLLPVLFVLQPALILNGPSETIAAVATTAILAVLLLAAAFEGYLWLIGTLPAWARVALGAAGLLLFIAEFYTDVAGAALAAATVAVLLLPSRRRPAL